MTDAERLLWSRIRRKQLRGYQFYRQRAIGRDICAGWIFTVLVRNWLFPAIDLCGAGSLMVVSITAKMEKPRIVSGTAISAVSG